MPVPVTMPDLGDTVTEAEVGRWLKSPGEPVTEGEPLLEILSDKVTAEVIAPASGVLQTVAAAEGDKIAIGTVIAMIALPDEAAAEPAAPRESSPAAPPAPLADDASQPAARPSAPEPALAAQANGPAPAATAVGERLYTPQVRHLAAEYGLSEAELASVPGSGLGGRLTLADLQQHLAGRPRPHTSPAPPPSPPTAAPSRPPVSAPAAAPAGTTDEGTLLPLTPMRRAIATHMARSVATGRQAWVAIEIDMSAVARAREAMRATFEQAEGIKLTYLPFFASAVIGALGVVPALNATWEDETLQRQRQVNLGIAVALDEGLVVPVIPGADGLNLTGLARAIQERVERARANRLTPAEMGGGTLTVNNTGAFGSILSRPIINQPQVAIVTMEAIVRRPVITPDDAIAIRPLMNACLTYDERAVDSATATAFLAAIKHGLEHWPAPDNA